MSELVGTWNLSVNFKQPTWIEVSYIDGTVERFLATGYKYNTLQTMKAFMLEGGGSQIINLTLVKSHKQDHYEYEVAKRK